MDLEYTEDYTDWERLIQYCESIDGLTELEKEKAKRAFGLLRKEFGDGFLKSAFSNKHPFTGYIINLAPWTRKWIIQFADSVQELKQQDNYRSLLKRLKDADKFNEGLSVLEIAYKLSKARFDVLIDPTVKVSEKDKIPDLKLINRDNREELYVEISESRQAKSEEKAMQTSRKIFEPLWGSIPFIRYCGYIHKTLAEKHLDQIIKKVKETIERAKEDNSFRELVIEGVIELGIAPESDMQILEKWTSERGLEIGTFSGPPFDVDQIGRIKWKIDREQNQLPPEDPNIVVIWNTSFFIQIRDMVKAVRELEESVYCHPHLMAVVIAGEHGGMEENQSQMIDQHVYIKKQGYSLLQEHYVILLNKFCEQKVSPSTIAKMYCGFGKY